MDAQEILSQARPVPAAPRPLLFVLTAEQAISDAAGDEIQRYWLALRQESPLPPLVILQPGMTLEAVIHPDAVEPDPVHLNGMHTEAELTAAGVPFSVAHANCKEAYAAGELMRLAAECGHSTDRAILEAAGWNDPVGRALLFEQWRRLKRIKHPLSWLADTASSGEALPPIDEELAACYAWLLRGADPKDAEALQWIADDQARRMNELEERRKEKYLSSLTPATGIDAGHTTVSQYREWTGENPEPYLPPSPEPVLAARTDGAPHLLTAPDERERCCVVIYDPHAPAGDGRRCPKASRYWVGTDPADDYTYCCAEHLQSVKRPGDAVEEVK